MEFADIDADGDLDAFIGEKDGNTFFFQNNSNWFGDEKTNHFGIKDIGQYAAPTFSDIDNDGDLDAFIGSYSGDILYFENTGTSKQATFSTYVSNPYGLSPGGSRAVPDFADIDGDGDLDLFVGRNNGNIVYFENIGTASDPNFGPARTNPFGLKDVGNRAAPEFTDVDADGDLDAYVGEWDGNTIFFNNTGNSSAPAFSDKSTNPFWITDVGFDATPAFIDIDADGDLDIFLADYSDIVYFRNEDTASGYIINTSTNGNNTSISNDKVNLTTSVTPVDDAPVNNVPTQQSTRKNTELPIPNVSIYDVDGNIATTKLTVTEGTIRVDLHGGAEITSGSNESTSLTLSGGQNEINSALSTLSYTPRTDYVGGDVLTVLSTDNTIPALSDTDTVDILIMAATAPIASGSPELTSIEEGTTNPIGDTVGNLFNNSFSDADGDRLQGIAITGNAAKASEGAWQYSIDGGVNWKDIVISGLTDDTALYLDATNKLRFLPTSTYNGTPGNLVARLIDNSSSTPSFSSPINNPFGLAGVDYSAKPKLADIDADGDMDAYIGEYYGKIRAFENTGNSQVPKFKALNNNPLGFVDIGLLAAPELSDIDADGDLDAFVGNYNGNTIYFENIGTSNSPVFTGSIGNPFGLVDVGYSAEPEFIDIDGDGDLDVFVGNYYGNIIFFENTGSAKSPAFSGSVDNPSNLKNVGKYASPVFVDLDFDGDMDAIIGNKEGNVKLFENLGTSKQPQFDSASQNPFGLRDVGRFAAPEFADLDGDGDQDAYIGNYDGGNTLYFKNTPTVVDGSTEGSIVNVSENGGSTSISAATLDLTTTVAAVDREAPIFTSGNHAAAIDENSGADQVVYTATATDESEFSFSLKSTTADAASFNIDAATGVVTLKDNPDHESKASYGFTVVATDANNNSAELTVTLAINDIGPDDSNSDGLVDRSDPTVAYQIFLSGSPITIHDPNPRPPFQGQSTYSDASSNQWDALQAIKTSTGNGFQLLLKGTAQQDDQFAVWHLNDHAAVMSSSDWLTRSEAITEGWDTLFGINLSSKAEVETPVTPSSTEDEKADKSSVEPSLASTPDKTVDQGDLVDPQAALDGSDQPSGRTQSNTATAINGTQQRDRLIGTQSDDQITGQKGRDRIKGRSGSDHLEGGHGKDRLHGGKGDDTLIGGAGADVFKLSKGHDQILDFSIDDGDVLRLGRFDDLSYEQVGSDVLVTNGTASFNTLVVGVQVDDLISS